MILNGVVITSLEQLETQLGPDINEASRVFLRNQWLESNGIEEMQMGKRTFGQTIINNLIDAMGVRNQKLIDAGTPLNVVSIASDNASIKLLIETGALGTAISLCSQLKYKYPTHADIYDTTVKTLAEFLQRNNYE
jgi:hypothetical protein